MNGPSPYVVGKASLNGPPSLAPGLTTDPKLLANLKNAVVANAIGAPGTFHPAKFKIAESMPQVLCIQSGWAGTIKDERFPWAEYIGADFRLDGGPLHVSDFAITRGDNEFHFRVWRATEGQGAESTDHGFFAALPDIEPRLCFLSRDSLTAFEAWWHRYRSFYDASEPMETLPRLPPYERVSVTPMEWDDLMPTVDVVERWAWISANSIGGRVWFTDDRILFEFDEDAVAYRMRWTGA